MAGTANSAYMMWRQFSPGGQRGQSANLSGYRAANIQQDRQFGQTAGEQLTAFAKNAGDFFGTYQKVKQQDEEIKTKKVEDWMNKQTISQYREAMRAGNVPFQDDPVSMAALKNMAAYHISMQVDEQVQSRVQAGQYRTVEEMDEARIKALEEARLGASQSMNLDPTDESFMGGFSRDATKRRELMLRLQTDVTDRANRAQAKVVTTANLLAPMTDEFISTAGPDVAKYISNSVKNSMELGLVRSDADAMELYTKAVDHLAGKPGGAAAIAALGDTQITLNGETVKFRDAMGGGTYDQAQLKAFNQERQQSTKVQAENQASIYGFIQNNDLQGLLSRRETLARASGGRMTEEIAQLDRGALHLREKIDRENAIEQQQIAEKVAKDGRLQVGASTMRGWMDGSVNMVSSRAEDLGFKDEAEAREAEEVLLQGFPEGPARDHAQLRLALFRPNGYADSALQARNREAQASWTQYTAKLARGEQAEVPPSVRSMATLYATDPVAFSGRLPRTGYTAALDIGRSLGMTPEDIAKAQVGYAKLPSDQRKTLEKRLTSKLGGSSIKETPYASGALKQLAGLYLQADVGPDEAAEMAMVKFKEQHSTFANTPIHNSFFAFSGERDSFEVGKAIFSATVKDQQAKLKATDAQLAILYDPAKSTVRFQNLVTGELGDLVGRGDLAIAYRKKAAASRAEEQKRIEAVIKGESAKTKAKGNSLFDTTNQEVANDLFPSLR